MSIGNDDPRLEWIRKYVDGSADPDTMAKLEEELAKDGEFRTIFLEYLNLDLGLALSAVLPAEEEASNVLEFPRRAMWTRLAIGAAAALILLLGMISWNATREPFARVVSGVGSDAFAMGQALWRQQELQTGVLEIVTARGVKVIIEAPAVFRFESAQRLHLMQGRMAADVPDGAKNFTVITPTGKAVDLGTKFGVDVPAQGESEIHVFEGEVIAHAKGGDRQNLQTGEAHSLLAGGGMARELRGAAFIRSEEMGPLKLALDNGQRARSEQLVQQLREDPSLITLLDFESSDGLPEGNYRMVQGRWPGSRAPEFVEVGDHMKLDVGGEHLWPQLTLAAWVRLDRLGAPYQSLLHTDGWANKSHTGQVHWMVTRHHTMRLALFGNTLVPGSEETQAYPDSLTSVLPEQGRWMHLVTVYDSEAGTVRFYLNGQFDKESRQEIAYPARLGSAQIGNWDQRDRKLSGRIDELVLLGRAMSDEEVAAVFEAGTPYR